MGTHDEHILKQIPFNKIRHLGIVVYMDNNVQNTCNYFYSTLRQYNINPDDLTVYFIAHDSAQLWAND